MTPLALLRRLAVAARDWLLAPAYARIDQVEDNLLEQLADNLTPLHDGLANHAAIIKEFYVGTEAAKNRA